MRNYFYTLAVVVVTSCQTTPVGEIYVGTPQVHTRERLVAQRQKELQWAQSVLNRSYNFSEPQVIESLRLSKSFENHSSISYAPKFSFTPSGANLADGSNTPIQSIGKDQPSTILTPKESFENTTNTLPDGTPKLSLASLTPINQLRREKAFRDYVNSLIKDAMLDDTHDSYGYELYELSFDVGFISNPNKHWAQVNFDFKTIDENEVKTIYENWIADLHLQLQEEIVNFLKMQESVKKSSLEEQQQFLLMQQRVLANSRSYNNKMLSQFEMLNKALDVKGNLETALKSVPSKVKANFVNKSNDQIKLYLKGKTDFHKECLENAIFPLKLSESNIRDFLNSKYSMLSEYITIEISETEAGNAIPQIKIEAKSEGFSNFKNTINNAKGVVLKITPDEISELASKTLSREDLLVLSNALELAEKNIGIKNNSRYGSKKQRDIHILDENMLSLSYKTKTGFGLLFGPRTVVNEKESELQHKSSHYDFSVIAALPGWLKDIRLQPKKYWIDWEGEDSAWKEKSTKENKILLGDDSVSFRSNQNFKSLTDYLLSEHVALKRKPEITNSSPIVIQEGQESTFLISGHNLWRNPQVFVGGRKAHRVELTSDMRGLYVSVVIPKGTFDNYRKSLIDRNTGEFVELEVKVVTSKNLHIAMTKAKLVKNKVVNTDLEPFVSYKSNYVSALKKSIKFSFDRDLIPRSYHEIKLILINPDNGDESTPIDFNFTKFGNIREIALFDEVTKLTWTKFVPRISIKKTPTGDWQNLTLQSHVIEVLDDTKLNFVGTVNAPGELNPDDIQTDKLITVEAPKVSAPIFKEKYGFPISSWKENLKVTITEAGTSNKFDITELSINDDKLVFKVDDYAKKLLTLNSVKNLASTKKVTVNTKFMIESNGKAILEKVVSITFHKP